MPRGERVESCRVTDSVPQTPFVAPDEGDSLVLLGLDGEPPASAAGAEAAGESAGAGQLPASFQCAECGNSFPPEQVFDAGGAVVCAACYARREGAGTRGRPAAAPAPAPASVAPPRRRGRCSSRAVTCPHCWHAFPPDQTLWVSQHTDLIGDAVLGPEAPSRFLPSRFNAAGDALDAREMACHTLACPRCHLTLPRALLEIEPLFVSVVGVPASGKCYFLTAMAWELRRILPGDVWRRVQRTRTRRPTGR